MKKSKAVFQFEPLTCPSHVKLETMQKQAGMQDTKVSFDSVKVKTNFYEI